MLTRKDLIERIEELEGKNSELLLKIESIEDKVDDLFSQVNSSN